MRQSIRVLSKLFNIRQDEWPRFLLIYLVYFVTLTGWQWGRPIVEAAFLTEVGVQSLPLVFVVNGIVTILGSAIYTAFADRVNNTKLLIALFIVSIIGVSIGLGLLTWSTVTIIVPLIILFLVLNVPLLDIFNIHWPIYVNSFYDTQSAKRTVPLLASGARFAGIIAGLTLPYLNAAFQGDATNRIVFIWLLTLVLAAIIAGMMPRLLRSRSRREMSGTIALPPNLNQTEYSYVDNIKEGFRFVAQSTFLRWLALAAVLTFALLPLINYQSLQLLESEFQSKEEISNFIARLNVIGNVIALPIQLFVLNRLIGRVGLGNASLIFPIGTMAISTTLIFFRTIPAAALGYINGTIFRTTFRNPVDNLLYNAVPLRVKGRARAFIVGLVVPVGGLIGGLLLLIPAIQGSWIFFALIGFFAIAFGATAFMVRRQYSHALIMMLEQEDFSFLFSQEGGGLIADPATLGSLKQKLEDSPSPEFTIFMAQLISQVGGNAAIPILGEAARAAEDGRVRAAILEVLAASGLAGRATREMFVDFLSDNDGQVRETAISGLERLVGAEDTQFLNLVLGMLYDPDINVRVRILSALARSGNFYQMAPAVESLNQFLADKDPERRAHAIRILGEIGDLRAVKNLADYLQDVDDAVRLATILAFETLNLNKIPHDLKLLIVTQMQVLLQDPIERVRQVALHILGQLGDHDSYRAMVGSLTDVSPEVRASAVDALVQVGKTAVPIIHPQFDAPDPQLRKMATVVLSRINQREYGALVNTHVTSSLLTIYQNNGLIEALSACQAYPSIAVLQSALREQNDQLVDEIFYLLSAIHDPDDVKIVAESLDSDSPRVRANAAEALESLTSPQTAQLVVPLFEPERPVSSLIAISEDVWDMRPFDTPTGIKHLVSNSESPWLRAIMIFALGEMGASLKEPALEEPSPQAVAGKEGADGLVAPVVDESQEDVTPEAARRTKRRNRRSVNLLDILGDGETKEDNNKESLTKPERRKSRRSLVGLLDQVETPQEKDETEAEEETSIKRSPRRRLAGSVDLLGVLKTDPFGLGDEAPETEPLPIAPATPFALAEIEKMIESSFDDENADVRLAARAARRIMAGFHITDVITREEVFLLSTIEKIIFLKEVPFFQGMTIYQLEVLANISEEKLFQEDERIFEQDDPGGALFVIVNGRVGIEQERRKGSYARLATLGPRAYFGETSLFDDSPRSSAAIAVQDTLTLRVRREPLIALSRQYPDLSLELISVLSNRLKEANDRIAELTRTRPRELQKLFDKFD